MAITWEVIATPTGEGYRYDMDRSTGTAGGFLREWRQRRRLSQLDLATEVGISQRHLSFVESGRSVPSRQMILRLSEQLEIPLRERNNLLFAAGFAPIYGERSLDDPDFRSARCVVERIIHGHTPFPALAVDRHWTLLMANEPVKRLLSDVDTDLLQPPVNVLRLSLHPRGMAPRIANYRDWRRHILSRLTRQLDHCGDPVLGALIDELKGYPVPFGAKPPGVLAEGELAGLAVPLELVTDEGALSLLSTTTVFGTPVDVSLSELAIEAFFPADTATTAILGVATHSEKQTP